MNTRKYIEDMLDNKIEYYKKSKIGEVTYVFITEKAYKKFMKHDLYEWVYPMSDKMLQKFNEEEFFIVVTDETIQNENHEADGTFIYALSEKGRKVNSIIIQADDNTHVFYHEFGHFIDACMGKYTCSFSNDLALKALILLEGTDFGYAFVANYQEQGMLRNAVKNNISVGLAQATYFLVAHEYFAESFALFISMPKVFKEMCPETYNYIANIYMSLF